LVITGRNEVARFNKGYLYRNFLDDRETNEDSEAVEKGSLATPCDFRIIKNQEVTSDEKSKNDRICGFSTASADSESLVILPQTESPGHSTWAFSCSDTEGHFGGRV
jgi:hypothetical protein